MFLFLGRDGTTAWRWPSWLLVGTIPKTYGSKTTVSYRQGKSISSIPLFAKNVMSTEEKSAPENLWRTKKKSDMIDTKHYNETESVIDSSVESSIQALYFLRMMSKKQ